MRVEKAYPGAKLVDSLPFSQAGTAAQAKRLKESGIAGVVGYLGAMNRARLDIILDAGLAYMPVTFAGEYSDGAADEIAQLKALGIPPGVTCWLDLEGLQAFHTDPMVLSAKLKDWALPVAAEQMVPGLYVGAPQPLTGKELFSLPFTRYWLGIGRCVDRFQKDAYPDCGWCIRQDWHGQQSGMHWPPASHFPNIPPNERTFVDTNGVQCDHRGRLPTWVVR